MLHLEPRARTIWDSRIDRCLYSQGNEQLSIKRQGQCNGHARLIAVATKNEIHNWVRLGLTKALKELGVPKQRDVTIYNWIHKLLSWMPAFTADRFTTNTVVSELHICTLDFPSFQKKYNTIWAFIEHNALDFNVLWPLCALTISWPRFIKIRYSFRYS